MIVYRLGLMESNLPQRFKAPEANQEEDGLTKIRSALDH